MAALTRTEVKFESLSMSSEVAFRRYASMTLNAHDLVARRPRGSERIKKGIQTSAHTTAYTVHRFRNSGSASFLDRPTPAQYHGEGVAHGP